MSNEEELVGEAFALLTRRREEEEAGKIERCNVDADASPTSSSSFGDASLYV